MTRRGFLSLIVPAALPMRSPAGVQERIQRLAAVQQWVAEELRAILGAVRR